MTTAPEPTADAVGQAHDDRSVLSVPVWGGAAAVVLAVVVVELLGGGAPLMAPLLTAPVYALVVTQLPALRIRPTQVVSPRAWLLYVGGLQLVLTPLVITLTGVARYTLPHLPDPGRVEQALLLQLAAFLAAVLALAAPRRAAPGGASSAPPPSWWQLPPRAVVLGFALVGVAGAALKFRTPTALLDYLRGAYVRNTLGGEGPSLVDSVATLLLPFLSFGAVLAVLAVVHRSPSRVHQVRTLAVLLPALLVTTLLFDYNRASLAVPFLALVAAYLRTRDRLPVRLLALAGIAGIGLILLVSGLRSASNAASLSSQGLGGDGRVPLGTAELQVYGSGPQFLGWALEHPPEGAFPLTTLSSTVYPVPKLGTGFRESSGPVVFNRSVYGDDRALDLIVPFQAEVLWDFGLPGLLLAYAGVGLLVRRCDDGYLGTRHPLGAYIWMYLGVWSCFLLLGSLAVVAQVALYSAAPLWLLALGTAILRAEQQARLAAGPASRA